MPRPTCSRGGEHKVEVVTPVEKTDPLRMYGGFRFRARCIKCNRKVVAKKEKDFDDHLI